MSDDNAYQDVNPGNPDFGPFYGEIRELYWDRDMTLGAVMQYFREKYDLNAT